MEIVRLSENLARLRTERGLSIQMFAAACDVSLSAMHSYLYDKKIPTLETLLKICNALRISPNEILRGLYSASTELESVLKATSMIDKLTFERRRLFDGVFGEYFQILSNGYSSLLDTCMGERISILRKDAGFSVETFAKCCSISRSTLAGIESSQKSPGTMVFLNICQVLSVSPEFLLCERLEYSSYPDSRYKYLTPRQIDGLLKIIAVFTH